MRYTSALKERKSIQSVLSSTKKIDTVVKENKKAKVETDD